MPFFFAGYRLSTIYDEGRYIDTNYDVDLGQAIFILTCNFMNENEIQKALGPAMFSRIGCCIEYMELTEEQKKSIIHNWYDEVLAKLDDEEKSCIKKSNIKEWFIKNVDRYDNIRLLKTKLENAVFEILTQEFVIDAVGRDTKL